MTIAWWGAWALSLDAAACGLWTSGRYGAAAIAHVVAGTLGLVGLRSTMPQRLQSESMSAAPVAGSLLLFVPVLGLVGLTMGLVWPLRRQRAGPEVKPLLRFRAPSLAGAPSHGATSSQLDRLAATRAWSDTEAVPLLRAVLADDDEEARLLAHALLARRERKAEACIRRCEALCASAHSPMAYLRAAQAHADLAESGLIEGSALVRHGDAGLAHTAMGLASAPDDARLHFVRGRLALVTGDDQNAMTSLRAASTRGLPSSVVAPYLWRARTADRLKSSPS